MAQRNLMRVIPALMLVTFAGTASASGFQLSEQNASGLGNAYAGQAAIAENASTIFFNPAGMTQLKDRELSGGLTAIKPSFKFTNGASNSNGQFSGNGGDGGVLGLVPNGYLSWAVNRDLYVGVGFGAPFGLKTEFDDGWLGAAQATSFDVKTYNINPSIAFRVNEKVSLGAGLNWQRIDAEYKRQVGVLGSASPAALPATTAATPLVLNLTDDSWGWNVGALFTVSPSTKIGLSYRSAIKYSLTGDIKLSGPQANLNVAGSSNAKADLELPDMFTMSVAQQISDKWQMLGDISWTGWSSIPKLDIYRTSGAGNGLLAQTLDTNFRDTWRFSLGANYQYTDAVKLKFGVAYDQTPVKGPESRLVSLPDNNRTWFSFGTQWSPVKGTTVDIGVAYLYLKDAKINNDQSTPALGGRGLVNGTFSDSAWILGAQYSMAF